MVYIWKQMNMKTSIARAYTQSREPRFGAMVLEDEDEGVKKDRRLVADRTNATIQTTAPTL